MLTSLFQGVFRLSIQGSILFVFMLICRAILRRLGAPKVINHLLWCALLFQLLCPWRIPLSLFTQKAPALETAITTVSDFSVQIPQTLSENLAQLESVNAQNTTSTTTDLSTNETAPVTQTNESSTNIATLALLAIAKNRISILFVLTILWCLGVILFLFRGIAQYDYLRRHIRLAYRIQEGRKIYYTGTGVSTPFILGIFSPRIYLPPNLADNEKAYIYRHEQAHLTHGDFLLKPLFYFALALHWFNPIVWFAMREMAKDIESACDETVLTCFTNSIKASYCNSLLRFAHAPRYATMPLCFGEGEFTKRIKDILNYKKPTFWAVVSGLLLVCVFCGFCLLTPFSTQETNNITLSTSTSTNNSEPTQNNTPVDDTTPTSEPTPSETDIPSALGMTTEEYSELYGDDIDITQIPEPTQSADNSDVNHDEAALQGNTSDLSSETTASPDSVALTGQSNGSTISIWWPVPDYDYISRYTEAGAHDGIDIAAEAGTAIYAAADGIVIAAGYGAAGTGYGYSVIIEHADGVQTLYAHGLAVTVDVDDVVSQGDLIMTVGSTGYSTGNHLHFEVFIDGVSLPLTKDSNIFPVGEK
ncbi:MAG: M56 family metallopeptidase [Faecalibacterium sp.]